jgi:hypothetical protein
VVGSWARTLWSDSEAEASASRAARARARARPSRRWRPRPRPPPEEGSMPPPARSGEEEEDTRVSRSREPWGSAFGLARYGETHESRAQQLAPAPGQGRFLGRVPLDSSTDRVACDVLPPRLGRSVILLWDAVDR